MCGFFDFRKVVSCLALRNKQKKFAEGIALGMKQGQAARYAGYSEKNADNAGTENMKNPEILAFIDELIEVKNQALRRRFSGLAEQAFDELIKDLRSDDTPPQVKVSIAKIVLEYAGLEPTKNINVNTEVKNSNPFEGLTTDELRKLIDDG